MYGILWFVPIGSGAIDAAYARPGYMPRIGDRGFDDPALPALLSS